MRVCVCRNAIHSQGRQNKHQRQACQAGSCRRVPRCRQWRAHTRSRYTLTRTHADQPLRTRSLSHTRIPQHPANDRRHRSSQSVRCRRCANRPAEYALQTTLSRRLVIRMRRPTRITKIDYYIIKMCLFAFPLTLFLSLYIGTYNIIYK